MHDQEEEVQEEVPVPDVLEEGVMVLDLDSLFLLQVFPGLFVVDHI